MNRIVLCLLALGALSFQCLAARDLTGQWQGTLPVQGGIRFVVKITQAENGALSGALVGIDESPQETPLKGLTLEGSTFRFGFDAAADRYEGTLSDDGATIAGKWFGSRHPGTSYPFDLHLANGAEKWPLDSPLHQIRFVTVADGVKLEVLDWGGTGRPLVLLPGLGNDAHVFDKFAPKLTPAFHVYGITRRGFGASSQPEPSNENYAADRLGDDVLAVIEQLNLVRPVVAGHSIAGEELSSIGSRHPEKVAGLIYLDAGYPYAFYDSAVGDMEVIADVVRVKLLKLATAFDPRQRKTLTEELLKTDLPQLVSGLEHTQKELGAMTKAELSVPLPPETPDMKFVRAVRAGEQRYTEIKCPVLAFFAVASPPDPASKEAPPSAADETTRVWAAAQLKAFETGVPSARIVRLPDADHYVFKSNEADVLREMHDFLERLP